MLGEIAGLGGGANQFANGAKQYGAGQIGAATTGAVDKVGYLDRDRRRAARKKLIANSMAMCAQPGILNPLVLPNRGV